MHIAIIHKQKRREDTFTYEQRIEIQWDWVLPQSIPPRMVYKGMPSKLAQSRVGFPTAVDPAVR